MKFDVQVFTRAPVPGEVKTRLIPHLGADGAAALHGRLLRHALHTATASGIGSLQLWCAPDTAHPFLQDCARRFGAQLRAQGTADLGMRMREAISAANAEGHAAVLIGSDSPSLQPQDLRAAAAALEEGCDAAFVPAEDGGYVLVAASQAPAMLFDRIEWGTPRVMAQTRERLMQLGWRWRELPPRWDVDRPEDYERLAREGWPCSEIQP